MIKKEELKKGDIILKISTDWSSWSSRHACEPQEVIVTSIGPKYITVNYIDSQGNPYSQGAKFNNDDRLGMKDWGQWKLFLGTKAEYEAMVEERKKASKLYYEIQSQFNRSLSYEKLLAIKTIIEAEPVDASTIKTLCEIL